MSATGEGAKKRRRGDGTGQVSLATLSAHLGLSQAAISRVLNHAPAAKAIPKATQERIFAAARLFKYRPNVLARSLRRGHSMTVGVLVPEISEGYATLVLAGLEQGLMKAGYAFFLCSHHHHEEVVERSQTMLVERAVDGIVAIDTALVQHGLLPTVTVSCPDPTGGATNIVLDHRRGAALALEHLHELGHRRIAVIKGQAFSSDTEPRWRAIAEAAERLGMMPEARAVTALEGDAPTHEPGYEATRRLLAGGARFSALFAFNDVSAIGAVRALREAGLGVPEDVSVVGVDDVQSAAFQNPPLTTVRQPLYAMGMLAAREIVRAIDGEGGEATELVVEPELVVRGSTAGVKATGARRRLGGYDERVRRGRAGAGDGGECGGAGAGDGEWVGGRGAGADAAGGCAACGCAAGEDVSEGAAGGGCVVGGAAGGADGAGGGDGRGEWVSDGGTAGDGRGGSAADGERTWRGMCCRRMRRR